MSAPRHTPGPWWVGEDSRHEDGIVILGPRKECTHSGQKNVWEMARIDNGSFPEHEDEDEANAHLIAAAPDLLEAAQITSSAAPVERDLGLMLDDEEITITFTAADIRQIRAALAKARGES